MFSNSNKFWNWLVQSSANPNAIALTVQGFFSLGVVQTLFSLLPLVGIHVAFSLSMVGASAYSIVYSVLTAVAALITTYGVGRKLWFTIFPKPSTNTTPLA